MVPPLCARTPTWTDSSSSARRESWTSHYLLPPTSSTAWRSEKRNSEKDTISPQFLFIVTATKAKALFFLSLNDLCFFFISFSTSSSSYACFPPFSRVFSVWRGSQWSSDFCQCSSTSCSRFWLRMTMMKSLLPPPGRQQYYTCP